MTLAPAVLSTPAPSAAALEHSARLVELIRREIDVSGGWLSFARCMDRALYAPGLGYYSAGSRKLGAAGDFVTAPEISPLFARTLACQIREILDATGGAILELGAGSGRLAAELLLALEASGSLPAQYAVLEVSADLRERQRDTIAALAPHLLDRVSWLEALPQRWRGLVFGNEVLDALPVHLVVRNEREWLERGVEWDNGLIWADRSIDSSELTAATAEIPPEPGYRTEVNLAARRLVTTIADVLEAGVVLFLDYGFGRREYYHPQRREGTLMCHYRHRAHDDPFTFPGLQDITAHVDFTAVAESGLARGLALLGYTTQAHFLVNLGITDSMQEFAPQDAARYLPIAAGVQKLLSPSEMGELFKVIALGRGISGPLTGFAAGDLSRLL